MAEKKKLTADEKILAKYSKDTDFHIPFSLTDENQYKSNVYRSTDLYSIDYLLSCGIEAGGMCKGNIIEIYGPEGSGKTTLASLLIAAIQSKKKQNVAYFFDWEHRYNFKYAEQLGVDLSKLKYSKPRVTEPSCDFILDLIKSSDETGIIVIDSAPTMLTKAELTGKISQANIGTTARLQSKLMSQGALGSRTDGPIVVILNQIRDNVGGMGEATKSSGARAIKFYSSVRVNCKRIGKIKDGDATIGQKISLEVVKNTSGRNFTKIETELIYGEGIIHSDRLWLKKFIDEWNPFDGSITVKEIGKRLKDEKFRKEAYRLCIQKENQSLERKALKRRKSREE